MADWLQQTLSTKQASPQQNATSSGDWLSSVASRKGQPAQQTPYDQPTAPAVEPSTTQQAPQNTIQKAQSLFSLVSQTVEKKLTSANIRPITPKDIAKVLIPEPVRNTANQLADKYVAGGAQGMKDRIKNLPNYPVRELFQITSADKYGQAERQYVKDTVKSAVRAIDGAGKLTAPYLIYRASIGDPVKPQEYVDNVKAYGMEMLGLAWRAEPFAPLINVGMGSLQGIRHYLEGKIDNKQLMDTPLAGLNNAPGFGEVLTDNVETAKAINIVFLATMIATPFARKGLRNVAMTSEELNMASRDLGVKPGSSLQEVSKVWKEKLKQLPDTFTGNPNPENMAMRVKLNDAYTVLKKAGVIDSKFAQAYDFLMRKMGSKPLEAVGFKPVPEKPLQLTSGEKPQVKPADTQLTAKSDTLISHEGAPDLKTVEQYKADIQAGKAIEPVKVIREGDKYGIEDGKHRFQAFQELGIKDIPITIVETPKVDVKSTPESTVNPEQNSPLNSPESTAKSTVDIGKTNSSSQIQELKRKGLQEYEANKAQAEIAKAEISLYSPETLKDVGKLKRLAQTRDVLNGDIETLRAKNPALADRVAMSVMEAHPEITTENEALFHAIDNIPTLQETRVQIPDDLRTALNLEKQAKPAEVVPKEKTNLEESLKLESEIRDNVNKIQQDFLDGKITMEERKILADKQFARSSQAPLSPEVQPAPKEAVQKKPLTVQQAKSDGLSFDEWLKTQGEPLYHGTNAEFQVFDKNKIGTTTDSGMFGRGFYFGNTESFARVAPQGRLAKIVMEVYTPSAKLLEIGKIKSIKEMADTLNMSEDAFIQDTNNIIRPLSDQVPQFTSHVKDLGYDGVVIKRGGDAVETVIFEPEIIKTKEQLRGEWDKAGETATPTVPEVKPKVVSVPREQLPVKSQGDVKTSKLEARMKGVLDKATQEQIDALGLSTFNQMNKAEQKTMAIEYVKNNPEDAMKVLKGDIEPPKGILKNSIYIAMDALASDNVELARKLASLESTRFGQELSILTELNPDSPVTVIKEIIKVKEDAFKKKYGKPVKEVVKKERAKIDKSIKTPDKWDWSAFVDSIQC